MLRINEPDNFRRTGAGLALISAPLAGLVGGLVLPATPADTEGTLAVIAENPGSWLMANLLFLLSFALLVPAVLGIMHLLRDRQVVLGHVGGCLLLFSAVLHAAVVGFALVELPIAQSEGARTQMVALAEDMYANPAFIAILPMTLFSTIFGTFVLAVAVWRARIVPVWAAALPVAGVASDFVLENLSPDVYFALTLVSFGWIAVKVLRMRDAEWGKTSSRLPEETPPLERATSVS